MHDFDPYDRDAAALRLMLSQELEARRQRYLAMPVSEQRAYAAAHPTFSASGVGAIPAHVAWQVSDAEQAGQYELARQLMRDYSYQEALASTARTLAATRVDVGERLVLGAGYGVMGSVITAISAATGYAAAGPHGALVAATPFALVTGLVILARLFSSQR